MNAVGVLQPVVPSVRRAAQPAARGLPSLAICRGQRGPQRAQIVASSSRQEQREVQVSSRRPAKDTGFSVSFDSPLPGPATTSALLSSPIMLYLLAEETGYSQASYYTTLGLFLMSFPGLYSLIMRAPKAKLKRKTFQEPGPASPDKKMSLDERAASLFAYFKRYNYVMTDSGETVTFEGQVKPEVGQAAYIVFCAVIGLASAGLVLSIAVPSIGDNAYWITALSPFAGVYYWANADRKQVAKVKIVTADDDLTTDVIVEADEPEIERIAMELSLVEKGKVYVKGIFDQKEALEKQKAA